MFTNGTVKNLTFPQYFKTTTHGTTVRSRFDKSSNRPYLCLEISNFTARRTPWVETVQCPSTRSTHIYTTLRQQFYLETDNTGATTVHLAVLTPLTPRCDWVSESSLEELTQSAAAALVCPLQVSRRGDLLFKCFVCKLEEECSPDCPAGRGLAWSGFCKLPLPPSSLKGCPQAQIFDHTRCMGFLNSALKGVTLVWLVGVVAFIGQSWTLIILMESEFTLRYAAFKESRGKVQWRTRTKERLSSSGLQVPVDHTSKRICMIFLKMSIG